MSLFNWKIGTKSSVAFPKLRQNDNAKIKKTSSLTRIYLRYESRMRSIGKGKKRDFFDPAWAVRLSNKATIIDLCYISLVCYWSTRLQYHKIIIFVPAVDNFEMHHIWGAASLWSSDYDAQPFEEMFSETWWEAREFYACYVLVRILFGSIMLKLLSITPRNCGCY